MAIIFFFQTWPLHALFSLSTPKSRRSLSAHPTQPLAGTYGGPLVVEIGMLGCLARLAPVLPCLRRRHNKSCVPTGAENNRRMIQTCEPDEIGPA